MESKYGFTTGTCAAIAAKAASRMIFEGKTIEREWVVTPKGFIVETEIFEPKLGKGMASCAVKKYSGDDPDVTNGLLIFVCVKLSEKNAIIVDGGKGVGRVTKRGLSQNIGDAAINEVPKKMIVENVLSVFEAYSYKGGAEIIISVPDGEKTAEKTFNSRLGIVGGISILGTSGIVEPMSQQALIDTIKAEISVKKENDGNYIMIAPGNYGIDFIKKSFDVDLNKAVKCGNFIGEALLFSKDKGFKGILLIGHIGKFIKLAGGIMNTHSLNADGRMEILAANTALVCDDLNVVRKIMGCVTTDDAIKIIDASGVRDDVMDKIIKKALFYKNNKLRSDIEVGIIMFSNVYGILGKSDNVCDMLKYFV